MTLMHHVSEQSDAEKYQQGYNELDDHSKFMMDSLLADAASRAQSNHWLRRLRRNVGSTRFAITTESCKFRATLERAGFKISELTCGNGVTLETVGQLLSLARLSLPQFIVSEPIKHETCETDGINAPYIEYTLTPREA